MDCSSTLTLLLVPGAFYVVPDDRDVSGLTLTG
jgi:hypothetical protein